MLAEQWIREQKLEGVVQRSSVKKVFLKLSQNAHENTCVGVSWPAVCNVIKKGTLTQVFSCELCDIFYNFFYQTPPSDCFLRADVAAWVLRCLCWCISLSLILVSHANKNFGVFLNIIFVRVFRLNFLEKNSKIIRTPFLFMSGRQLFSDALKVLEEWP